MAMDQDPTPEVGVEIVEFFLILTTATSRSPFGGALAKPADVATVTVPAPVPVRRVCRSVMLMLACTTPSRLVDMPTTTASRNTRAKASFLKTSAPPRRHVSAQPDLERFCYIITPFVYTKSETLIYPIIQYRFRVSFLSGHAQQCDGGRPKAERRLGMHPRDEGM